MADNTKRSIWSLSGLTGMLIAVVLLLSILVFLQMGVLGTYQAEAKNPYDAKPVRDINNLKMVADVDKQKSFVFQSPKEEK